MTHNLLHKRYSYYILTMIVFQLNDQETTRRPLFTRPTLRPRIPSVSRNTPSSATRPELRQRITDPPSTTISARDRFRNRVTTERTTPVTTERFTTLAARERATRPPRVPRPDRTNTRTRPQIKFGPKRKPETGEDELTTDSIDDQTEGALEIVEELIIVDNVKKPNASKEIVDHRILVSDDVPDEVKPSTSPPIRFEDLFSSISTAKPFVITTEVLTTLKTTQQNIRRFSTTPTPKIVTTEEPVIRTRGPTTTRTIRTTQRTPFIEKTTRRSGRPAVQVRKTTPRPVFGDVSLDYIYNDDGALGGDLGDLAELTNDKAQLLSDGSVKCLETGYFSHPDSCKRFISCSKTVRGAVRGWVYTCPQQLVFDPVGGMCNWAEAVDCKGSLL